MRQHRVAFYIFDGEAPSLEATDVELDILPNDAARAKHAIQRMPDGNEFSSAETASNERNAGCSTRIVRETDTRRDVADSLNIDADNFGQRVEENQRLVESGVKEKMSIGPTDIRIFRLTARFL